MGNNFINDLALRFAPTYWASEKEKCYLVELEKKEVPRVYRAYPPWNPFIHFSVRPLEPKESLTAYEINYLAIWDWDRGLEGHQWDTERTAILVVGPQNGDADDFSAREAYYAAHEGALTDSSEHCACPSKTCGVTVYWSEGKHASYINPGCCLAMEMFERPGFKSSPGEYTLFDIGTIEDPKVPWLLYRKKWDPRKKVDPIYKKLKMHPWGLKSWEKIERPRHSEEEIERFQKYEGLEETGERDKKTVMTAQNVDNRLLANISAFTRKGYEIVRNSTLKGIDIDFVARANLSVGELEKIVQKNLHGSELREYVKGVYLRRKFKTKAV